MITSQKQCQHTYAQQKAKQTHITTTTHSKPIINTHNNCKTHKTTHKTIYTITHKWKTCPNKTKHNKQNTTHISAKQPTMQTHIYININTRLQQYKTKQENTQVANT